VRAAEQIDDAIPDIDAALSFVPDEDLQTVADACIDRLRQDDRHDRSQAASLVAHLSLQRPTVLSTRLAALHFPTGQLPIGEEFPPYGELPWRGASSSELQAHAERLKNGGDVTGVWRQLIESRSPGAIADALRAVDDTVGSTPP